MGLIFFDTTTTVSRTWTRRRRKSMLAGSQGDEFAPAQAGLDLDQYTKPPPGWGFAQGASN